MGSLLINIPLMIFVIFILPVWLILHYRSKNQMGEGMETDDYERLDALMDRAREMEDRVRVLENILDDELPQWRKRHYAGDEKWRD